MFFRRILAFVALAGLLLGSLGACTPEANPPQTVAAGNPAAVPRPSPLPRAIERETGPVYNSPQLQALVDRIGDAHKAGKAPAEIVAEVAKLTKELADGVRSAKRI